MEQSVVIRHMSGTKGPAVEQIPIAGRKELIAGRGSSCDIRYDLAADDLVSRRHMKIEIAGTDAPEFAVVDLNSRNGTFVNKRRIKERSKLRPGDVVQLGAGGPEFVFDLDPPNYETAPAEKTTAHNILSELTARGANPKQPTSGGRTITGTQRSQGTSKRRSILALISVLILLGSATIVLVSRSGEKIHMPQAVKSGWTGLEAHGAAISEAAAYYSRDFSRQIRTWFHRSTPKQQSVQNKNSSSPPTAVVNVNCLTSIETGWMLLDARSGRQLRQVYIDNLKASSGNGASLLVPGAGRSLPLFVLLNNNRLEPVLTLSDDVAYRPIGGIYRNSGFLASPDGLILTGRRIAAPWTVSYDWPSDAVAGVVAKFDKHLKLVDTGAIARRQFPQWLPMESQFILADSLNAPSLRLIDSQVRLEGRTDYLTVSLVSKLRNVPARVVRTSDRSDLAVIRIEGTFPGQQSPVTRLRVGSDCKPGDPAILLSLGSTSPPTVEATSVSEWNGKVVGLRKDQNSTQGSSYSTGDRYELAVSAGPTFEAGLPVFDEQGRVFAIETTPDPLHASSVFAVPIRYGIDLLSPPQN